MSYCLLVALLLFFPSLSPADEGLDKRLKELKLKIEQEEGSLNSLKKESGRFLDEVSRIRQELTILEESKRREEQNLKQVSDELKVVELTAVENERRAELEEGALEERVRELYKLKKRGEGVQFILASTSSQDLLRRSHLLKVLALRGDETLNRLLRLQAELVLEREKLDSLRKTKNSQVEELRRIAVELDRKRRSSEELLVKVRAREREQDRIVAKLRLEMQKLEKALSSVMGESEELRPDDFKGVGLANLKGKLSLPVAGRVLQGYGKAKHGDFKDSVFVKGLEIGAPVGSTVKPVSEGKVVLAQILPGFGNVVIVDHGQRYYTLYGRLASTLVGAGQVVSPGTSIGIVGEQDHRGRNFYFELRHKGQAVDPKGYLRQGQDLS
jgi:septal ring factor EnvC (AmiA/AmiB activator)